MKDTLNAADTAQLLEFLYRLGQAYIACGEQTAVVELKLRRIATAHGMRRARVVAFPTAIFIAVHDGDKESTTLAEGPTQNLRLDQIADVYRLGDDAQAGKVSPTEGLSRISEVLRKKPRFGNLGVGLGQTILAIGLAIVLEPSWPSVATAAVLGGVVGVVKVFNRERPILAAPMAVVAAMLVSTLVFLGVRNGLNIDPLHSLVPPLVAFLPGAMLTFGMIELAYGDMVSGTARLVTGFVQLVLLTFGLMAGAALVGYRPENLVDATRVASEFWWSPWIGTFVFAVGVYLHSSGPGSSFLWMTLVLMLALASQRLAAGLFGQEISGFFGTLVATPVSYLIQLRLKGPPAMVMLLPSFWLLVPGSLGLLSMTRILSDRYAGGEGLISALFTFASIAIGTLVGASMYKWFTEHFGWWELKLGRVGRYFRR